MTGALSALAAVLMFLDFSVPLIPSFIKLDFSELPALIASFAIGPVAGGVVCLVKNLIHLTVSQTGGVGELANFLLGFFFVVPAGLIYKFKKDRTGAFLGALSGSAIMGLMSFFTNLYITYPFYYNFMPQDAVLGAYRAILSSVNSIPEALLIFNVPFTFVKGLISVIITFIIYKKISPIIKGTWR